MKLPETINDAISRLSCVVSTRDQWTGPVEVEALDLRLLINYVNALTCSYPNPVSKELAALEAIATLLAGSKGFLTVRDAVTNGGYAAVFDNPLRVVYNLPEAAPDLDELRQQLKGCDGNSLWQGVRHNR